MTTCFIRGTQIGRIFNLSKGHLLDLFFLFLSTLFLLQWIHLIKVHDDKKQERRQKSIQHPITRYFVKARHLLMQS